MTDRRIPPSKKLHVVRWVRADGRDVKHRYFTREYDAVMFANRLRKVGKDPLTLRTNVDWQRFR